jgi:hypothetical protein
MKTISMIISRYLNLRTKMKNSKKKKIQMHLSNLKINVLLMKMHLSSDCVYNYT